MLRHMHMLLMLAAHASFYRIGGISRAHGAMTTNAGEKGGGEGEEGRGVDGGWRVS